MEPEIVEKMIKVHPVDLSEFTSVGLDELPLREGTRKTVIRIPAMVPVILETSRKREV